MTKNNLQSATSTFSRSALAYLRKADWTPTRTVQTSVYESAYAAENLPFVTKVKDFLQVFGGLVIRYQLPNRRSDVLEFLAERAVRGMGGDGLRTFEDLIGVSPLFPVGHYLFGTCMLLMDAKGMVFGGSDTSVSMVGRTGKEAIEAILTGSEIAILEPKTA